MTTPWTETTSRNHRNHNNPPQSYQEDHPHHDDSGENPASTSTADHGGVLPQRKKLQLKPRSVRPADATTATTATAATTSSSSSAKSNPFGMAKPREVVLAEKGVDARLMDLRIEQKVQSTSAHHKHYTKEQERQLDSVRTELTTLEEELRDANENELPEQAILEKLEVTRKTLKELTTKFDKENEATAAPAVSAATGTMDPKSTKDQQHLTEQPQDAANRPRFERPSQRRQRLEEDPNHAPSQHHQNQHRHPRSNHHTAGGGGGGGGSANTTNPIDGEAYSSFSTNRRRRGSDGV